MKTVGILEKFQDAGYYSPDGHALRYRLFKPACAPGKKYPLVIFLHGMGERGLDNSAQITANGGAHLWADDAVQKECPCYILAPQCPSSISWVHPGMPELIRLLIEHICASENVDTMRIYITGLSMGAIGTWNLIARYPDLFAAAIPVCGAGTLPNARLIGQLPVWALHAADDPVVPVDGELISRVSLMKDKLYGSAMVVAEAVISGSRSVRLTVYPEGSIAKKYGNAHASWEEAFRDSEVRRWLFSQSRISADVYRNVVPGVWECADATGAYYYIVEGRESALVIDTGMGQGNINEFIQGMTRLPYSLALTHGHGDHSMHCSRFDKVYLDSADKDFLFASRFGGQETPEASRLIHIDDGYEFDLGGGVVITTVSLPGHTPGSLLFVDKAHKCVFTGDAVGSGCGVWMQVPNALDLSEYAKAIATAEKRLAAIGIDSTWRFLGGHGSQRFASSVRSYNPILPGLFSDMRMLCEKLVSGEIVGSDEGLEAIAARFGKCLRASYGTAEMLYRPEQLK